MSFGSSLLRTAYKLSGVKKAFALPEDELLKVIEKANRGRGFFMPTDRKARYEKKMVNGFPCLIVRAAEKPARRAILFFFGGGMVIGPDKSDAAVLRKLCYGTDSDVWFPIYPSAPSIASRRAMTWPMSATARWSRSTAAGT